jgi:hypothetical protein
MSIEKFISPFIESQFPSFYKSEGPNFIAFVKAYYEWMETEGQVVNYSRQLLDIGDVDNSLSQFMTHFKNKYINGLPENVLADRRLLIKHIVDLYNSKGTKNSYKFLFRMMFNEDIDVYIPADHLFSSSSGTWVRPKHIEVGDHPNLKSLEGKVIRSSSGSTAVVDSFSTKRVKGKLINVLYLSDIQGDFYYGEKIYSPGVIEFDNYSPKVFGSLTTISILNGGAGYNVGDVLDIRGTGSDGQATVASVTQNNGRVAFELIDGGYGYTINAIVSVVPSNGSGSGATFSIGAIADKQILKIYPDSITPLLYTKLDQDSVGYNLVISNSSGSFATNENITGTGNTVILDVGYISGGIYSGESLTNTSIGITGANKLIVYKSDGNLLYTTGSENALNSPNLYNTDTHTGAILVSNITGSSVTILNKHDKITITGNAALNSSASNTKSLYVYSMNADTTPVGYFIPGSTITGSTSGTTAKVVSDTRLTDWNVGGSVFPAALGAVNLDTPLKNALRVENVEIGRIAYLTNINPGTGYAFSPTVTISEPIIYSLDIKDGRGGFWGYDAVVRAKAGTANGVVTSIRVTDSGSGYVPDEYVYLVSNTNDIAVSGIAIVDSTGTDRGYYVNNKGFLSDTMYLQDSNYYQEFAYEIAVPRMLDTYKNIVLDLVHPVGMSLFGKYAVSSRVVGQKSLPVYFNI